MTTVNKFRQNISQKASNVINARSNTAAGSTTVDESHPFYNNNTQYKAVSHPLLHIDVTSPDYESALEDVQQYLHETDKTILNKMIQTADNQHNVIEYP